MKPTKNTTRPRPATQPSIEPEVRETKEIAVKISGHHHTLMEWYGQTHLKGSSVLHICNAVIAKFSKTEIEPLWEKAQRAGSLPEPQQAEQTLVANGAGRK
jgi:hypothetical protein